MHYHDPVQFTVGSVLYYGSNEDPTTITFTRANWPNSALDFAGSFTNAFLLLLENSEAVAAIVKPYNYQPVGGAPINTVENAACVLQVLDGVGGVGFYEHLIETSLANAQLITFPTDNVLPHRVGAGSPDVGAGSDVGAGD